MGVGLDVDVVRRYAGRSRPELGFVPCPSLSCGSHCEFYIMAEARNDRPGRLMRGCGRGRMHGGWMGIKGTRHKRSLQCANASRPLPPAAGTPSGWPVETFRDGLRIYETPTCHSVHRLIAATDLFRDGYISTSPRLGSGETYLFRGNVYILLSHVAHSA